MTPPRLLTERVGGSDREPGPGDRVYDIELRVAQGVVQELVDEAGWGGQLLVGQLLSDDEEPFFRDPGNHAEVIQVGHPRPEQVDVYGQRTMACLRPGLRGFLDRIVGLGRRHRPSHPPDDHVELSQELFFNAVHALPFRFEALTLIRCHERLA